MLRAPREAAPPRTFALSHLRTRVMLAVVAVLPACTSPQNVLETRSPAAARIAELWWVMFGLATAVSVVVIALLLVAVHRSRQRARGKEPREIDGRRWVWAGGVIIPAIILFSVLVYSYRVATEVYPPLEAGGEYLTIEVIGHQFWWEVHYPELEVTTANEIHLPVGRRVRFLISSPDVIHSFWIPQLQGKIDMIPGRISALWVQADEPGLFRGQCAEYCGMAHALMALWVVALPTEEFAAWVERRRAPPLEPPEEVIRRGREIFFAARCGQCHATRGVPLPRALGTVGPDLSDLAARRTLAAGTLLNTRENLAEWIVNPQAIKPGSRMPPTLLDGENLAALILYLESLR